MSSHRLLRFVLLVLAAISAGAEEATATSAWFQSLLPAHLAAAGKPSAAGTLAAPDLGGSDATICVWIRTGEDGVICAKQNAGNAWAPQEKALFLRDGRPVFDVGFVSCCTAQATVADGKWHHLALVSDLGCSRQEFYVDGSSSGSGGLALARDPAGASFKVGWCCGNFPATPTWNGALSELRIYHRVLTAKEVAMDRDAAKPIDEQALVLALPFRDDQEAVLKPPFAQGAVALGEGRFGKALHLERKGHLAIPPQPDNGTERLWQEHAQRFPDARSRTEMAWERQDAIWRRASTLADLAAGYAAAAARHWPSLASEARSLAAAASNQAALTALRAVYLTACRREQDAAAVKAIDVDDLRRWLEDLGPAGEGRFAPQPFLARLEALARKREGMLAQAAGPAGAEAWLASVQLLRREAITAACPEMDFDRIVFVKRHTYDSNHYYTEFINSTWKPGGTLCILDLKDGSVQELSPQLSSGVVERFDLSFDARRIVFAWKSAPQEGYRIYEVNVDGTGLRQLTRPQADEAELVKAYRVDRNYHHGTDDMSPCYLPDGGIAFISTRCQYGILCDPPDNFTTTVLHRMDANGGNLRQLSSSSVSEASPTVLADGRIMYTRWEYVDKGAVSVKCLWAMRPDGSGSAEVYGNDIALPPTLIYGRPVPGMVNRYVVLGTPHCPQNGVGTVIRLDMTRNIRTREPMTYMTPYVDIRAEGGFSFRNPKGEWHDDGAGRGPLFKEPYPLSNRLFLVAHKPAGPEWRDAKGYGLYLLDEQGRVTLVYRDPAISCWLPFPLKPRPVPPLLPCPRNEELAAQKKAQCIISDVYHGLEGVPRGAVRYIRIIEQVPRPWATRYHWAGDEYDQQYRVISKDTHLGLKVQHGVVPVEEDGSANFLVPAAANIILQVLDGNYLALQTERTFVDYMPGETRSCIGCHETPNEMPKRLAATPKAVRRAPSLPGPQPGETSGCRPLHYESDVQPVWDRHCLACHSGRRSEGSLDLSGTPTERFNVSYEGLVPERRKGFRDRQLLGPVIGENHPKTGHVDYLPALSLGSHASVLVAMLAGDMVTMQDATQAQRVAKLKESHKEVKLTREELIRVANWVDTNCQYYGSWWGRRHLQYKGLPDFRPIPTFAQAISPVAPPP